jgi:uncharacterized protein YaiI (UPF0178 family)
MQIWVDADACPGVIKEILFRAAQRTRIMTTLVANQMLRVPPSPYIRARQVPSGFDVADQRIVQDVQAGDLVITADIPLAALVVERPESTRRVLHPGKHQRTPEHAQLHGRTARQRRRHFRTGGFRRQRPAGFCRAARSLSGQAKRAEVVTQAASAAARVSPPHAW